MNFEDSFKLSQTEAELLFALEYMVTDYDISSSAKSEFKQEKEGWLQSWRKVMKNQGFNLSSETSKSELITKIKTFNQTKAKMILFEAFLFKPYFNLGIRATTGFKKGEQKKKSFTKESYLRMENLIKDISEKSLSTSDFLDTAKKVYEDNLDQIPNDKIFSLKKETFFTIAAAAAIAITGGLAAPAIGTIIGGMMGLSGAAATSAGLALLGGGAIASGGAGMVGGTAIIIGGGALFGGVSGSFLGSTMYENNSLILTQLAKLITNIKVFTPSEETEAVVESCLITLKKQRKALSEEVEATTDAKKKANKKKSLLYYVGAIKVLQSYEEELLNIN